MTNRINLSSQIKTKKIPKVLLLVSTERGFGRDLIRGITRYVKVYGPWSFYREPPYFISLGKREKLSRLRKWQPNGIITRDLKSVKTMVDQGIPTIIASYEEKLVPNMPNIISDGYKIGQMAAEHLLERGFQQFAFFGLDDLGGSIERGKGFFERIKQAGFETSFCKKLKFTSDSSWENIPHILVKWLKSLPKPIGIMASSGELALNVLEASKSIPLYVPEEISLITTDNDELIYNLSYPPVSSIAYNTEKAGYEAAELLGKMMAGEKITPLPTILIEPTHVEQRLSTDSTAIEDPKVAKALSFIRENSQNPINVDKVLDHVILSRRELNKRFKRILGRTVLNEIARVRTNEIALMLLKTDLPISQISKTLGFTDDKHISRYFKGSMGLSPKAYRAKHSNK
jgi:LacI family transcriptional regulator